MTIAVPEPDSGGTLALLSPAEIAPDEDPYLLYLSTLKSAESRRTMGRCLDRIAAMLLGDADADGYPTTGQGKAWWEIDCRKALIIRAALMEQGWSPSHVNKHLSALRSILWTSWKIGRMSAEDYQRAKEIKKDDGKRLPAGRSIHADEHAAIEAAFAGEDGPKPHRDATILRVLRATGLRRAEVAKLSIEDWDPAERRLRVHGKGDKERWVPLYPSAATALDRWIVRLDRRTGPLFPAIDRWGNITWRHMDPRTVGRVVDHWRRRAGVSALSTHDFRRSAGGDMLDGGLDLAQVQAIFGHASPDTTANYDRRPGRKLRDAVDRIDPVNGAPPA